MPFSYFVISSILVNKNTHFLSILEVFFKHYFVKTIKSSLEFKVSTIFVKLLKYI